MEQATDVLIVGGGVIGCSIAYHLAKQGIETLLLERGEVGAQASGAAAGIFSLLKPLAPIDAYNRLLLASLSLFPALVAELEEASGTHLEYEQTGTLRVSRHAYPKGTRRLQRWVDSCQAQGLQVQLFDERETHQREPLLAPDICASTYLAYEGQVRASRVVEAFALSAQKYGASLVKQQEVIAVQHEHRRVRSVTTAHRKTIKCNRLVVATGAWAGHCDTWFGVSIPIVPQRGQVLSLRQPSLPICHILIGNGIYVAPKQDNTIIVGATKEAVGFDCRVTAGGILWLLESAIKLVPALADCALERTWAGLRPSTPDNEPILGRLTGWENVSVAVGHNSFGILLSAITGQSMAELLVTGQVPEIIRPFALERFSLPLAPDRQQQVDNPQDE